VVKRTSRSGCPVRAPERQREDIGVGARDSGVGEWGHLGLPIGENTSLDVTKGTVHLNAGKVEWEFERAGRPSGAVSSDFGRTVA